MEDDIQTTSLNTLFKTKDIGEAAFLVSLDFLLLRLERINNTNKFYFVFKDKEKCELNIRKYWNNSIQVTPRKYFEAYKSLKARIFAEEEK